MSKTITIFGSSYPRPGEDAFQLAYEVGRVLGSAGYTIANGGYGGIMLASAQGAAEAGARAIGVTCTALGRSGPNAYITEERSTADLAERVTVLIELGDAYCVLPGGTGTLLELAQVWELANKGLGRGRKPIILIGAFWEPLVELIAEQDAGARQYIRGVRDVTRLNQCLDGCL